MRRLPVAPIVVRALDVGEKHLGIAELCRRLNAPWTAVKLWRTGDVEMPEHMFLRLVDILTELDPSWTEGPGPPSKLQ